MAYRNKEMEEMMGKVIAVAMVLSIIAYLITQFIKQQTYSNS